MGKPAIRRLLDAVKKRRASKKPRILDKVRSEREREIFLKYFVNINKSISHAIS